jgi:hypothetical protein
MTDEYEPYWPDDSVPPRIYRDIHTDCQANVNMMYECRR